MSRRLMLAMLVMPALCGGCNTEPPLHSVKGQVVFKDDGKPFTAGTAIVFESKEPPYHRARGELDGEGRFVLQTEQREGEGAMEGVHRVSISYQTISGQDLQNQLSKVIDPKYFEFRTSGIEVDIKPDQPNEFKIELDRPK
jgi:hypothetical protein